MRQAKISRDTIVTQMKELVSTELDGETVLMSIKSGKYYGMDKVSSRIWSLIETPRSLLELVEILVEEYDVTPAKCEQDVLTHLNKLERDNLIKVIENGATA
jgi:hypothetical protein